MIITALICNAQDCLAIYLPPGDTCTDTVERAARRLGWTRRTAFSHACPACSTGNGPVRERGECLACTGSTVDARDGMACRYCRTVTPHPTDHR
ncbi:hypothetical protein [Streptomyces sp. NPDC057545]|uniref:hypothetical protein n=1 Tax=Streptomyces sp. NPDC057545 TaxID=3346164 RepID=UPI0036B95846